MAASLWNKSSWASPRPVGALLRCRWRAYGGGSPNLEPLYRSRPAVVRRPWWRRMELVLSFQDAEEAVVAAVARRMDRARASRAGVSRRRRVSIPRRRSSGCSPDRWLLNVGFSSSAAASIYCGPLQSLCAMGFPSTSGSVAAAGGGVGRRRSRGFHESSGCQKSKDLVVIFAFLEVLSDTRGGTAVFRIPVWVTCMCTRLCTFP